MAIVQSLLFGSQGDYRVCGIPVRFKDEYLGGIEEVSERDSYFVVAVKKTLQSYTFRVSSFSFLHIFIHEMGHALTQKMLCPHGYNSEITVITNQFGGKTSHLHSSVSWKDSLIYLGGPLTNMVFSCSQLALGVLLSKQFSCPLGCLLSYSGVIWMIGELTYAFTSLARDDAGDFAKIARNGTSHALLALAVLVSTCALGIYTSVRLAR